MSLQLDLRIAETGTRFHIFPQPRFLKNREGTGPLFPEPEEVVVDVPPEAMQPGPADDRMFVVDAVNKLPYNHLVRPPYRGQFRDPVEPGPAGHYTHLEPGTREFSAATMYATVRRVLDIMEDYFGFRLAWHFDSLVDYLLGATRGNLLTVNGLDRVGELSDSREIRVAFNALRMSDVGEGPHRRSLPLTGAVFDTMVEIFQEDLVQKGLITDELRVRSTNLPGSAEDLDRIAADFDAAYTGRETEFEGALLRARDEAGRLLARTWANLSPDHLTDHEFLRRLLRSDREVNDGRNQSIIRECFAWREIAPVPTSLLLRPHSLSDCGLRSPRGTGVLTRSIA